ncbi:hypothetical protein ABZ626_30730 [Streptomyces longispororuber]|uniref:hypothetical protein n=1 Tax=Streptomyces longispororuber TaxID=68230 RepID=UPI00340DFB9A
MNTAGSDTPPLDSARTGDTTVFVHPVWGLCMDGGRYWFGSLLLRRPDLAEWRLLERKDVFLHVYGYELAGATPSRLPPCLIAVDRADREHEVRAAVGHWASAMRLCAFTEFVDPAEAGTYTRTGPLNRRTPSLYRQHFYDVIWPEIEKFTASHTERIQTVASALRLIGAQPGTSPLVIALDNFRNSYTLYIGDHAELSLRFMALECLYGPFGRRGAVRYRDVPLLERLAVVAERENALSRRRGDMRDLGSLRNTVAHTGAAHLREPDESLLRLVESATRASITDCLRFLLRYPETAPALRQITGETKPIHAYNTLLALCHKGDLAALELRDLYTRAPWPSPHT